MENPSITRKIQMLEIWENPLHLIETRYEIAVGAIECRDAIIKNLRTQLAGIADLPQMPEPLMETPVQFGCDGRWYSSEQMLDYAEQCVKYHTGIKND